VLDHEKVVGQKSYLESGNTKELLDTLAFRGYTLLPVLVQFFGTFVEATMHDLQHTSRL
jgi:hypothetical protein